MIGIRSWHRPLFLGVVVVFSLYTILLYGRPSWLPVPPRPFGSATPPTAGQTAPGRHGGGSKTSSTAFDSDIRVPQRPNSRHPILQLIDENRARFKQLLGKRSLTLEQAAARYRERRQRHPPPGFDVWFETAQKYEAVVVEDFFDRVYDDLAPFWALDPRTMRTQAHSQPQLIRVRKGEAFFETDDEGRPPWIQTWTPLIREIAEHLPDLDMVLNVMDETRLLVPWDKIREYVAAERTGRTQLRRPQDMLDRFSPGVLEALDASRTTTTPYAHSWITNDANRFWDHLRAACPPDSPARNVSALAAFDQPVAYPQSPNPAYTTGGFVSNATAARDPCLQPHLRGMHGTFIESVSMSTSHELLPMFAGCKLPQNNEILIPGAMYLTEDPFYSGGQTHGVPWADKKSGLVWRGTASGGRSKADNWWHFHRHRWVQMTNGTTVAAVERGDQAAGPTFALPAAAAAAYRLAAQQDGQLGAWVASVADVGFVDLECFPGARFDNGSKVLTCDYTSPHMAVLPGVPMEVQYGYKLLPDVDGNSYSARWRGFLRSTSLPLKATIYAEWHDDRLVPWVHYAPFDSSYLDFYAVADFFLRGHDEEAARLADESRIWADAVLRREDMRLYVWRLLLEYARIVDDRRDILGYVADLL